MSIEALRRIYNFTSSLVHSPELQQPRLFLSSVNWYKFVFVSSPLPLPPPQSHVTESLNLDSFIYRRIGKFQNPRNAAKNLCISTFSLTLATHHQLYLLQWSTILVRYPCSDKSQAQKYMLRISFSTLRTIIYYIVESL
jgi:hypothetical protein